MRAFWPDTLVIVAIIAAVFVKRFFSTKVSCTYTMNFLHQE